MFNKFINCEGRQDMVRKTFAVYRQSVRYILIFSFSGPEGISSVTY